MPSSPNGLPIATTGSPTCEAARVAERERVEQRCRRVHLDDREIRRRIGADELGADSVEPFQNRTESEAPVDDVLVRDDDAVARVHEAGALRLLLLLSAELVVPEPDAVISTTLSYASA